MSRSRRSAGRSPRCLQPDTLSPARILPSRATDRALGSDRGIRPRDREAAGAGHAGHRICEPFCKLTAAMQNWGSSLVEMADNIRVAVRLRPLNNRCVVKCGLRDRMALYAANCSKPRAARADPLPPTTDRRELKASSNVVVRMDGASTWLHGPEPGACFVPVVGRPRARPAASSLRQH